MTRVLPRTHFHSSRLIRILADLAVIETVEPGNAFAEKLALWVDFSAAINLCAVHSGGVGVGASPAKSAAGGDASHALSEEFARARAGLEHAIASSCKPSANANRLQLPTPPSLAQPDDAAAYAPYRRFHLAHQRDMELSIRPLRIKVRQQVAWVSPTLSQLTELDEALDNILDEREKKLLAIVPSLLEKRHAQLRKAQQQSLLESGEADNPALWMKPGGWLARFCHELQTVLLAELDLRLQPIVGLIEAHNPQKTYA